MDLVTGSTGIVGAHLLHALARRGRRVRALVRGTSDREVVRRIFRHHGDESGELFASIEWQEGDLLDILSLEEAMQYVERVLHAAALVSFDPRDNSELARVNVAGTRNVVNAALGMRISMLGYVSSTASIGRDNGNDLITEAVPWEQTRRTSPYATSKFRAEMEVERGRAEGLPTVIVNPCVVLGPGPAGRSSMTLVERIARGTRFHPPGSNAVVDARDVADTLIRLCEAGITHGRYLLVGENITYKDLFQRLAVAFGARVPHLVAAPWMLRTGSALEAARSLLTGSRALITPYTVDSALSERSYSTEALQKVLPTRFRSAQDSIEDVVRWVKESEGLNGPPPSNG